MFSDEWDRSIYSSVISQRHCTTIYLNEYLTNYVVGLFSLDVKFYQSIAQFNKKIWYFYFADPLNRNMHIVHNSIEYIYKEIYH